MFVLMGIVLDFENNWILGIFMIVLVVMFIVFFVVMWGLICWVVIGEIFFLCICVK